MVVLEVVGGGHVVGCQDGEVFGIKLSGDFFSVAAASGSKRSDAVQ